MSTRRRRVAFLIYDGIQSLDLTGPLEVFATASKIVAERHSSSAASDGAPSDPWDASQRDDAATGARFSHRRVAPYYQLEIVAPTSRPITSASGLRIVPDRAIRSVRSGLDTVLVAGGRVDGVLADRTVLDWLVAQSRQVRRLASVCSGAFLLGEAGLLRGRRATTHWAGIERFTRRYADTAVEPDALFVRDGRIFTSAGVTSGIDLALALVEDDLGHAVALEVARWLVVFLKRPGGQSQFSSLLAAQSVQPGPLRDLPEWIVKHLGEDLSVEQLAVRAAMSPRNFARVFRRETGTTPAKFVERARLDAARRALENEGLGLEEVADRCGFGSAEQMRRAFRRHLRIVPIDYRKRFHRHTATAA